MITSVLISLALSQAATEPVQQPQIQVIGPRRSRPICRVIHDTGTRIGGYRVCQTPEDLQRHNLLYGQRELDVWRRWCRGAGIEPLDMRAGLQFDTLSLTYQAARGGAGVALGDAFYVNEDLLSGRLVAPFKLSLEFYTYHLVYPRSRAGNPALVAFRDWILTEAAATNASVDAVLADFRKLAASVE